MKYSKQVYDLSTEVAKANKNNKQELSEDTKALQRKVLRLLIKKFLNELDNSETKPFMKVKFYGKSWSDFNDGFNELRKLDKQGALDSFLREYCMHVSDFEDYDVFLDSYYEIAWDYMKYYEQYKNRNKNAKKRVR